MISLTDLKDFVGVSGSTYDDRLTDLEAGAVAFVESQTNRYFRSSGSTTEYIQGSGKPELWLLEAPIGGAAAVTVSWTDTPGGTATTLTHDDDDGFLVRTGRQNHGYLLRRNGYLWTSAYEWTVVYTRGYTEDDAGPPADVQAPEDIRQAVRQIVAYWFASGRTQTTGLQSEKLGDYSYSRAVLAGLREAIPGLKDVLDNWKQRYQ